MKNRLIKTIASLVLALMILISLPLKGQAADYPTLQPGAGYPTENYKFSTTRYYKKAESWVYNTSTQVLQGNGKTINGYCFAGFQWDQTGQIMRLISIEEYMALYRAEYIQSHVQIKDKVPVEIDLDKIRVIAMNSRLTKSLAEVRQLSGVSGLTEEEASKAAQLAIWTYTDGLKTRPASSTQDYAYYEYYLNYPSRTWWGKTTYTDLQTKMTANETKYYRYLIGLEGIPKPAEQLNLVSQPTVTYPDENTAVIKYDYLQGIKEPVISFEKEPNTSYEKTTTTSNGRVYVTITANITQNDKFCVKATGNETWDIAIMAGSNQPKVVVIPQIPTKEVCVDIVKPEIPKTDLVIDKKDVDTGALLPDAEFTLKDQNGDVLQTAVSDANGRLTFTELKPGSYTITETKAPENYQAETESIQIEVKSENGKAVVYFNNGAVDKLDVFNKKKSFNVDLIKQDGDSGEPLPGAEFELRNSSNELVSTQISDDDGFMRFSDIAPGTYTLTETYVPYPFRIPTGSLTVNVDEQGVIAVSGALTNLASVSDNKIIFNNFVRIY